MELLKDILIGIAAIVVFAWGIIALGIAAGQMDYPKDK